MTKHGPWPGTWRLICDVCGFEFASNQVKKRWDGLYTCHKDWELDHPQKFVRVRPDRYFPEFIRPEPEPVFGGPKCNMIHRQGRADVGTADCAQADYVTTAVFE